MKDIFLIRHGRQCSKLCNVDVSLDESGRKQAKLAGKRLISYQLEKLYCSQLIRAKETAEIIGHCVNLPVEEVADIEEIHFGGFTGKRMNRFVRNMRSFVRNVRLIKKTFPIRKAVSVDVMLLGESCQKLNKFVKERKTELLL